MRGAKGGRGMAGETHKTPVPAEPGPDPRHLAALNQESRFLHSLMEHFPDRIYYKDRQSRFIYGSRSFARLFDLDDPSEFIGKTDFDYFSEAHARAAFEDEQEIIRTGEAKLNLEERETWPDGRVTWCSTSKAPFRDDQGRIIGTFGISRDITSRKEAQEALRQHQELLSAITRNVTDLMAIVDQEGAYLYASPSYATVLGYSPGDLPGSPPMGLVHPQDQPQVRAALAKVFALNAQQTMDYRLKHQNGQWLDFECRVNPIPDPCGHPAQALIVARDVSARKAAELERKRMEVQLRHAQKLESIGSLAAGIAHEINTPTQYIGDNTSFLGGALPGMLACLQSQRQFLLDLQSRQALPAEGAEVLGRIENLDLDYLVEEIPKAIRQTLDGVARVTSIVSAMKYFSHPGEEAKTPADLNQAIQSTLIVSRNEWKYLAELETDLDPGLPPVPCLLGEVNQAILNLVVNAAHAIEESLGGRSSGRLGHIRVETRHVGQEVRISVSDNGMGIPASIRDRIFEPFFTTKAVGKGTGQGLAIVHAVVVEKHGGRVTVESEPGTGTTFNLFLPLESPSGPLARG